MYDHILIPYDGSADAVKGARQGVRLAAALGATVHGLCVVQEGGNPWESTSMDDQRDRAIAYGEEVLAELREMAEDAGAAFESEVRIGPRVYEEINDYVETANIDLIAMGSGYHGEFGGLLGGTADKVLRTAHVPVLVLRRELREGAAEGPSERSADPR